MAAGAKQRILDPAERWCAELGCSATSLGTMVLEAKVNLAAHPEPALVS